MADSSSSDAEPAYVAEAVRDMRRTNKGQEFFIKWGGYDSEENTWEPYSNVRHLVIVKDYITKRQSNDSGGTSDPAAAEKAKKEAARRKRIEREEAERKREAEHRRRKKEEKHKRKADEARKEAAKKLSEVIGLFQDKPKTKNSAPQSALVDNAVIVIADDSDNDANKPSTSRQKDVIPANAGETGEKSSDVIKENKSSVISSDKETKHIGTIPEKREVKSEEQSASRVRIPSEKPEKLSDEKKASTENTLPKTRDINTGRETTSGKNVSGNGVPVVPVGTKITFKKGVPEFPPLEPFKGKLKMESLSEKSPEVRSEMKIDVKVKSSDKGNDDNTPEATSSSREGQPLWTIKKSQSPADAAVMKSSSPLLAAEETSPESGGTEKHQGRCGSEEIPEKEIKQRRSDLTLTIRLRGSKSPEIRPSGSPKATAQAKPSGSRSRSSSVEIPVRGTWKGTAIETSSDSDSDSDSGVRRDLPPLNPSSSSSSDKSDDEEEYEVSGVVNVKGKPPFREFFVEWAGYDSDQNTWEPEDGVIHLDIVQDFLRNREKGGSTSSLGHKRERHESQADRKSSKYKNLDKTNKNKTTGAEFPNFFNQNRFGDNRSRKGLSERERKEEENTKKMRQFKIPKSVSTSTKLPDSVTKLLGSAKTSSRKMKAVEISTVQRGAHRAPPAFCQNTPYPVTYTQPEEQPGFVPAVFKRTLSVSRQTDSEVEPDIPVTDASIVAVLPREDPTIYKLIMNTGMPTVHARDPEDYHHFYTRIPDFAISPPVADRFSDLYKRMEYLRISATAGNRDSLSSTVVPPLVTPADCLLEKACRSQITATATRGMRQQEVLHDQMDYFRSRILKDYDRRAADLSPYSLLDPGGVCVGKEIPLFVRGEFRNPIVMKYLGRDSATYDREKKSRRSQKVMKQVQRPPRYRD